MTGLEFNWVGSVFGRGGIAAVVDGTRVEMMRFKPDAIGAIESRQFPILRRLFKELWIVYISDDDPYLIQPPEPWEFIVQGKPNQAREQAEHLVEWFLVWRQASHD